MKFDYNEITFTNNPNKLVIFLHGYGADKHDLMSLNNEFKSFLPKAHFISLNAPFKCEIGFGYQWFSLYDRTESVMYGEMQSAVILLNNFIDEQLNNLALTDRELTLVGFSQGTMMALHVAIRRSEPSTVIGYSGMIVEGDKIKSEAKSKPNILLIHGEQDEVIPKIKYYQTIDYLKQNNFKFESHLLKNLAHNIDQDCLEITRDYLVNLINKDLS